MICFLLAGPALAEPPPLAPLNMEGRYSVAWNGIGIGRIILISAETSDSYHLTVDTKASGIGSLFSSEKRVAESRGQVAKGNYIPAYYNSRPQKDGGKDNRRTTLIYDPSGRIASREQVPQDDPSYRPLVPASQTDHTLDTVTGALALRKALYEHWEAKTPVTTKTYDGSRLAEMKLTPLNTEPRVMVMKKYIPSVDALVTRTPINGYTAKELKKYKAGDPEIHIYFSADEKFIPLRATVDTAIGQLSATLVSTK